MYFLDSDNSYTRLSGDGAYAGYEATFGGVLAFGLRNGDGGDEWCKKDGGTWKKPSGFGAGHGGDLTGNGSGYSFVLDVEVLPRGVKTLQHKLKHFKMQD